MFVRMSGDDLSPPFTALLEAALFYAARGLRIVPLHTPLPNGGCSCGRTTCRTPGKHPRIDDWPSLATTDARQIATWWVAWPSANVGLALGQGLIDIEVDPRHGGDENLPAVEKQIGGLPDTVTWISGGGGAHRLYRIPDQATIRNATSIARDLLGFDSDQSTGIDVRSAGGLAVLPPSAHESGVVYRWGNLYLDALPIAPLPEAWIDYLTAGRDRGTIAIGDGNPLPEGTRNSALTSLAGNMRRVGMTEREILAGIRCCNVDRCRPPLDDGEVARIAHSIAGYEPDQVATAVAEQHFNQDRQTKNPIPSHTLEDLVVRHPELKDPLITGLLRVGETMNVIAAPKVGKSWLVLDLALAVAMGRPWLDTFATTPGRVLIIDNELHPETSAFRIRTMLEARGIALSEVGKRIEIVNLRGRLMDLHAIALHLEAFEPGHFQLVIIDAWYRTIPVGIDENDNGAVAGLYNTIDAIAARLRCSFVLIHHTSKGVQAGKSVTDVGAGAGSQSRATDVHVVLRRHRLDDTVVLGAVVRSWRPVPSLCLRWEFPLWHPAPELDPEDLDVGMPRRRAAAEEKADNKPAWTPASFLEAFLCEKPRSLPSIIEAASRVGLSERRAQRLLEVAEEEGIVHRWPWQGRGRAFATSPPPEEPIEPHKRDDVRAYLEQHPEMNTKQIAEQCGVSPRYVQKLRKELANGGANWDANWDANSGANSPANWGAK
jgi:AraC-like DNA-binding protein